MRMPALDRIWTVDDLDELPDDGNRYEIIDGELFVTPAPAWPHQRAAGFSTSSSSIISSVSRWVPW